MANFSLILSSWLLQKIDAFFSLLCKKESVKFYRTGPSIAKQPNGLVFHQPRRNISQLRQASLNFYNRAIFLPRLRPILVDGGLRLKPLFELRQLLVHVEAVRPSPADLASLLRDVGNSPIQFGLKSNKFCLKREMMWNQFVKRELEVFLLPYLALTLVRR